MSSLISENRTELRNKSLKVTVVTGDIAFVMINVASEKATSSPISSADRKPKARVPCQPSYTKAARTAIKIAIN